MSDDIAIALTAAVLTLASVHGDALEEGDYDLSLTWRKWVEFLTVDGALADMAKS
jgi:hypothetical protein